MYPTHTHPFSPSTCDTASFPLFPSMITSHINKCQARKGRVQKFLPSRPRSNPRLPSFLRRNVGRSFRPLKQEVLVKRGKISTIPSAPFDVAPIVMVLAEVFFCWGGRVKVITLTQKHFHKNGCWMVYCNKSTK